MKANRLVAWKPQNEEPRVASARIRCLNTLAELRRGGYPIELYREKREARYRAVIFSKAYNPRDVATAERLKRNGVKVVFDLCDNHFVSRPDRRERLTRMFELADHWVVSSEALGKVVRQHMGYAKPLTVIEDAVEEALRGSALDIAGWLRSHWQLRGLRVFLAEQAKRGVTPLVWFGNHRASYQSSGLAHMEKLRPLLEATDRRHSLSLTVISSSREAFDSLFADWRIPIHYIDWSAHTFFIAMRLHRIALIPIEVNEFTAVKTNNRIALSLWLGLGAVADSIDSYRVFSDCAFLDDWERGLDSYLDDPGLIARHVEKGRAIIRDRFSLPRIAGRWQSLMDTL